MGIRAFSTILCLLVLLCELVLDPSTNFIRVSAQSSVENVTAVDSPAVHSAEVVAEAQIQVCLDSRSYEEAPPEAYQDPVLPAPHRPPIS